MNFSRKTKVKDIALFNPAARQVLEDVGLDYCCGGGRTLDEACLHADVSPDEILNRLRENSRNITLEDQNWIEMPVSELTRHIRQKHHHYVREAIYRTQPLLGKVISKHATNHAELDKIGRLFTEVSKEMIMHMQKEEQVLFPYIDALERAASTHEAVELPFFQTVKNPIHAMMKEHDAAGNLVKQIRELTSDYTAPAGSCNSFNAPYEALREFEMDLHQHVHLENNVLFPRAVEMESAAV
jgi:regulator of cell morphogenesis and NO signaling